MLRKKRSAWVVLGALFAVSGVLASSSVRAEGPELHISAAPAVITGLSPEGSTQVLTFQDSKSVKFTVVCNIGFLEGKTTAKATTDVTLTPQYLECKSTGFPSASVRANGCKYKWHWAAALTANVEIMGCTPKPIEVELGANCLIDIPAQSSSHIVFQNIGPAPKHLSAATTLSKLTYEQVGSECPGGNKVLKEDGEISGTTTVKAFEYKEEKLQEDRLDLHQYTEYVHTVTKLGLESS